MKMMTKKRKGRESCYYIDAIKESEIEASQKEADPSIKNSSIAMLYKW